MDLNYSLYNRLKMVLQYKNNGFHGSFRGLAAILTNNLQTTT